MSIDTLKGKNVDVRLWTPIHEVESTALDQLKNVAALPWVFHHVAVMPDVHFGKGATVGSVIAMKGAVSPAAVGVDIGCGMGAVRTNLRASEIGSLVRLRSLIENRIPVGFEEHAEYDPMPVKPTTPEEASEAAKLRNDISTLIGEFKDLDLQVQSLSGKAVRQLGTLGGGNHFIELCLDEGECDECAGAQFIKYEPEGQRERCKTCSGVGKVEPRVWLMLHSGSRNIGKTLAEVHMARAQRLAHNVGLPDRELSVFLAGTREMDMYRRDLFWAQRYAMLNRRKMFQIYQGIVRELWPHAQFEQPILCHHNYVAEEFHYDEDVLVTRKGAIRAGKGELGIIPGSMGTKSYIVSGRGSAESFCSASHGAGRRMSRGKAKKSFTLEDLREQTKGVECRKDEGVLDEIPGAYKDIDQVMMHQRDLVNIVHELKQILCVKG